VDRLDVVNLRVGGVMKPSEGSIEEPLTVLAEIEESGAGSSRRPQQRHSPQLQEGQRITEIVCVQNFYNLAHRDDDAFVDALAKQGIAYVPFFPLEDSTPLQSSVLDGVAGSLQATQCRSRLRGFFSVLPTFCSYPATSSINHLRENLGAAALGLPSATIAELNAIAKNAAAASQSAH